jgi:hypothetical protein
MTVNLGAYASEIVRAGIEAIPHGQVEAAHALGLKRLQIFRFIILFPALKTVYPALASQFILLMLSSSVVSTISAVELTAAGIDHLSILRVLLRGDRPLPRPGAGLQSRPERHLLGRVPAWPGCVR